MTSSVVRYGHRMLSILGAALACAATTACAQDLAADKALDAAVLRREAQSAVELAGGLTLSVNSSVLHEGDSLQITTELPREGYLNVVSINPSGVPTVLFPNKVQASNRVQAGRFVLPSPEMHFEVQAAPPFGDSLVIAFLTKKPLDLYQLGEGQKDASGNLVSRFAQWSRRGQDLVSALGTASLTAAPGDSPMLAGMVNVTLCAKSGPCGPALAFPASESARAATSFRTILDALTPGILREPVPSPEAKSWQDKRAPSRVIYAKGIKLTKVSEGFVQWPYNDAARFCSIAYGHLIARQACNGDEPAEFLAGVTEPVGAKLLKSDMALAQSAVMSLVKTKLTDGQYAALCDFTYNIGSYNFRHSTLLKVVNAGQHARVPAQIRRWVNAGGKPQRGLVIRRDREVALYFDGSRIPKNEAIPKEMLPAGEDAAIDVQVGEPDDTTATPR